MAASKPDYAAALSGGKDAGADGMGEADGGHEPSKAAGGHEPSKAAGDDGGLGVVRIKPLGAGGGGGEASAVAAARDGAPPPPSVRYTARSVTIDGRRFDYPRHVIGPEMDQRALYDAFMPQRVQAFLDGINVNIMAYGQTGSGKTHTVFGPPGIMARAAGGAYGDGACAEYGLFPRALLQIFDACEKMRAAGSALVLTASAVELSLAGNIDMLSSGASTDLAAGARQGWDGSQKGVAVDRMKKPSRLYGMTELPLESVARLRDVYAALATRNTAATGMNDSSSRSHCFAFLTLRVRDGDKVRTSRFQFADLAGSERIKDAHGENVKPWGSMESITGMMTNFSLTMLSQAARGLVDAKRRGPAAVKSFSFRAFIGDLVPLLQESMTGEAATACFVCLSQAPDNLMQSKFALDFGEVFAKLDPRPRRVKPVPRAVLFKEATSLYAEAKAALGSGNGGGKYRMMRIAQQRAGEQALDVLARFGPIK